MVGRNFLHREDGISSVEFAIVCSVFFLFIFGIIDFSRALWEWNSAAKATHVGVRYAVVNDPVTDAIDYDGIANGFGNGQAIPIDAFNGGKPVICTRPLDKTICILGNGDVTAGNDAAFRAIVDRMKRTYYRIDPDNVIVEYRHIGLGFSGNPFGSDIIPAVTIRLQLPDFEFVTPGLSGILTIGRPDFQTTFTAEDHQGT
jgi:hypothetical protein